jgi:hypothetical protein
MNFMITLSYFSDVPSSIHTCIRVSLQKYIHNKYFEEFFVSFFNTIIGHCGPVWTNNQSIEKLIWLGQ